MKAGGNNDPTTTMGGPASATTTTSGKVGPKWAFHLKTKEGWEYDVRASIPVTFSFAKDVSGSPPGRARMRVTVTGQPEWVFTPTIPGRTAPMPSVNTLGFNSAMWPASETFGYTVNRPEGGSNPCGTGGSPGPGAPTFGWSCSLSRSGVFMSGEYEERVLDQIISEVGGKAPSFYVVDIGGVAGGCSLVLYPDGRASKAYPDTTSCTLS